MVSNLNRTTKAIDSAAERYDELYVIRAAVQSIPFVGGAIDTIISGRASQIQKQRIEEFLLALRTRLERIEAIRADGDSEEFADFMLTCFDQVWRGRTADKRQRFATIVACQIREARSWDDADMAIRLLSELEDIHIHVLRAALRAKPGTGAFDAIGVVALEDTVDASIIGHFSTSLTSELGRDYSAIALRLACSELAARGLLHDEGVGRWDSVAMTYFIATDLAAWLFTWLAHTDSNTVDE